MATANHVDGSEGLPINASCLRISTRAVDEAVVEADNAIVAIRSALEGMEGYELIAVKQLLTGARRLLKRAQDEIGNIDAELDRRGEGEVRP